MKLENMAYAVVQKTFWELEHNHHYIVPQEIQKSILESITDNLDELIQ